VCANSAWKDQSLTAMFRQPLVSCSYEHGLTKREATGVNHSDLRNMMVAHTGQSSQLFSVASGRNAQVLATPAKRLRRRIISAHCIEHTRLIPPLPRRA
jgi:hypothetical protein